jgi:crotonobetainyl-CoA:carnitine CoA-transferase CaiB-like acyl-CoA transferase
MPLQRPLVARPVVLDLSALWAGPLASHLLQRAGARVIKVESSRRPDGARRGPTAFFDLLHAGKESVALDLASAAGRADLVRLVARADIVIESARPRALAQLGIDAGALVTQRRGLIWIRITGYGCSGPAANWIGFGDDAATAAGLAAATGAMAGTDTPLFCADAIADPLTGMHVAVAALGAYRRGGGVLLSLTLRDVAAHVLGFGPSTSAARVCASHLAGAGATWDVIADGERLAVQPARARHPDAVARPLGADTDAVLRETRGRL